MDGFECALGDIRLDCLGCFDSLRDIATAKEDVVFWGFVNEYFGCFVADALVGAYRKSITFITRIHQEIAYL